ncbi:MAG: NAD(P)/FAD-dependent oxidoreductase [Rhodoglobus sp.]
MRTHRTGTGGRRTIAHPDPLMSPLPSAADAVVIGAGPAGLAAAAELTRAGLGVVVLDKADRVGSSWSRHYDRLHLHTVRQLSSLPGTPIPRKYGAWVARDDLLTYLSDYAESHKLDVRLGVSASAVSRLGDGWQVSTDAGVVTAPVVVVATGYNHTARIPDWTGLDTFGGKVIHSSEYRNPAALGARSVLVVGPGNSGAEIAADLAASGAAVQLAVRTTPNIVRRAVAGIPSQYLVLSISMLPLKARDVISSWVQKVSVGDLTKFGIPKAPRGIVTQMERDDVTPTIDVGLLAALRKGTVTVVPAVTGFTADSVLLADGSAVKPDAVVVATGFSRGLDELVGSLGVLAPKGRPVINADEQSPEHPGLYFIGYSNPLAGNLRQLKIDAGKIARRVARGAR